MPQYGEVYIKIVRNGRCDSLKKRKTAKSHEKAIKTPAKIAKDIIVVSLYALYRPKYVYENKELQTRKITEPCVIIANHCDVKDAPFLMSIFEDTPLTTMMAKDWYEKKELTWLFAGNDCVPVDRYGLDTSWIHKSVAKLKQGSSVLIFPEGHTTKKGKHDKFKSGFVMLAMMANVPVLPICLDREYHAVGKRKKLMIGVPTPLSPAPDGMTPDYLENEAKRFADIIDGMQAKLDKVNSWI